MMKKIRAVIEPRHHWMDMMPPHLCETIAESLRHVAEYYVPKGYFVFGARLAPEDEDLTLMDRAIIDKIDGDEVCAEVITAAVAGREGMFAVGWVHSTWIISVRLYTSFQLGEGVK